MTDIFTTPIYKSSHLVYKYIRKLGKLWRKGR